jgi:bifunctional non-homologous end joining protein LigD
MYRAAVCSQTHRESRQCVGRSRWVEGIIQADMATPRRVRPAVVVQVSFVEWTRDTNLQHAAFVALRNDKQPSDVRRETGRT